jgi:hypothetical protein
VHQSAHERGRMRLPSYKQLRPARSSPTRCPIVRFSPSHHRRAPSARSFKACPCPLPCVWLTRDPGLVSELDEHASVVPWTIVNRYYTADVRFLVHTLSSWASIQHEPLAPALLFVWNRGEVRLRSVFVLALADRPSIALPRPNTQPLSTRISA